MAVSSLGHKASVGAVWAAIDRFGVMTLQFVVNMVLARLLTPEAFGVVGMLAIFIAVSQVIIDGGFASALIQKKNPTQTDYSTIFYWNIIISSLLYAVLFFAAPLISRFYEMATLCPVLRIMGISLILQGVVAIQVARLRKCLSFNVIAITNVGSYLGGSAIAIYLAYHGWGVWSLVLNQLFYNILCIILFFILTQWHPSLVFSKATIKELFGFGGYIMAANILQTACQNLQGVIIGKRFSATQMGYFSQAYKLDQITSYAIPQIIVQVMYPVYSTLQDDIPRLRNILMMNIRVLSFAIFPILAVLIIIAEPLLITLYGTQWLPAVPYYKILCIGGMFVCLQNVNFYAVAAVGKSKALFYWSFYKWGFLILALLGGMFVGMYGILIAMVLSSLNIYLVNAYLVNKYLSMPIMCQVKILLPIFTNALICFIVTHSLNEAIGLHFIISVVAFLCTYSAIAYCFRFKALSETVLLVSKIIKR